jgi:hypothetical protein
MSNFIFIHGTGGNPNECFYPWLRRELENRGYKVYAPQLPMPEEQTLGSWLEAFRPYEKFVNEKTCFVGRSIGPAFILRLLERMNVRVKACFLVAGFCSDIGLEEFRPLIKTFIEGSFNWEKITNKCDRFFVYNSDNDPYVPLEKGRELAKNLNTEVILVKGAEHFWMREFQEILSDIKTL